MSRPQRTTTRSRRRPTTGGCCAGCCATCGRTRASVAAAFALIVAMSGLDLVAPYLTKVAIDRYIARGDADGLSRVAGLYLLTLARRLGRALLAEPDHADDRAADHAGPAPRDLRPPAAAARRLLRPQPRGPADDARDDRRRRRQRAVHLGRRDRVRRPVRPGRHHGRDAVARLAARARHLLGDPAVLPADELVPQGRAQLVPRDATLGGADQRLPAGEPVGHGGGAAVPARGAQPRPSSRRSTAGTPTRTCARSSTTPSSTRRSSSWPRWRRR